jgi:hypothetical protein
MTNLCEIIPNLISPKIKMCFGSRDPAGLRCIAVLQGIRPGKILAESVQVLNWVVV